VIQVLHCPYCQGTDMVRHGTTRQATLSAGRARSTDARFSWRIPTPGNRRISSAARGYGPNTERIKKEPDVQQVNQGVWKHLPPEHVAVESCRADELVQRRGLTAALDERWSYVGKKAAPQWRWHAIAHASGTVVAYGFGRRQATVFLQLKEFLEP